MERERLLDHGRTKGCVVRLGAMRPSLRQRQIALRQEIENGAVLQAFDQELQRGDQALLDQLLVEHGAGGRRHLLHMRDQALGKGAKTLLRLRRQVEDPAERLGQPAERHPRSRVGGWQVLHDHFQHLQNRVEPAGRAAKRLAISGRSAIGQGRGGTPGDNGCHLYGLRSGTGGPRRVSMQRAGPAAGAGLGRLQRGYGLRERIMRGVVEAETAGL